jgi:hypothetical protein
MEGQTASFLSDEGAGFIIAEEDISALGSSEVTLEGYTDMKFWIFARKLAETGGLP